MSKMPKVSNAWLLEVVKRTAGPVIPPGAFTVAEYRELLAKEGRKLSHRASLELLSNLVHAGEHQSAKKGGVRYFWKATE
jgi:hypothetical protein